MPKEKKPHTTNIDEKLSVKGSFEDVIKASVFSGRKGQIKKQPVKAAKKYKK